MSDEKVYMVPLTEKELLVVGKLRAKRYAKETGLSFIAWGVLSLVVVAFSEYAELVKIMVIGSLFVLWVAYLAYCGTKAERQAKEIIQQYME